MKKPVQKRIDPPQLNLVLYLRKYSKKFFPWKIKEWFPSYFVSTYVVLFPKKGKKEKNKINGFEQYTLNLLVYWVHLAKTNAVFFVNSFAWAVVLNCIIFLSRCS